MTTALAGSLDVHLSSPGVCPACLGIVAMELDRGDPREIAKAVRWVAGTLWLEGFGDTVRVALERRTRPEAPEAQRDFRARGLRSEIYLAVVRRLAEELEREVRRESIASLN